RAQPGPASWGVCSRILLRWCGRWGSGGCLGWPSASPGCAVQAPGRALAPLGSVGAALLALLALGLHPLTAPVARPGATGPGLGALLGTLAGAQLHLGDRLPLGQTALLQCLLCRGPGCRHPADHVELLAHGPQVGGGPVDQHTEGEVDTGH